MASFGIADVVATIFERDDSMIAVSRDICERERVGSRRQHWRDRCRRSGKERPKRGLQATNQKSLRTYRNRIEIEKITWSRDRSIRR